MFTALLSLSLLAATPVATDPVAAPVSVTVSYRDLNLHTSAGRAQLDRRLASAVNSVCPIADHRQLRQVQAAETCRTVARRNADQQRQVALASIDTPILIGSTGR